jgi:hypothetical protein
MIQNYDELINSIDKEIVFQTEKRLIEKRSNTLGLKILMPANKVIQ